MTEPGFPDSNAPTPPPATPAPVAATPAVKGTEQPGWERATMEKLLFATLEEQRTARRWRSFVRLAWLAFFVFLLWALMPRGAASTDKSSPHTAVIEIKGEIASGADTSAEAVVSAMRNAFEDSGAQALVLVINS